MKSDYYQPENLIRIMNGVEKMGKLSDDYFSDNVRKYSEELKMLRKQAKALPKNKRDAIKSEIMETKALMDELKEKELRERAKVIGSGTAAYSIKQQLVNDHQTYVADGVNAVIICQIIKQELRRSYKLMPADRDTIVGQIIALLDNPMPKVVIRADIHHFFETIPQNSLLERIENDGFLSHRTVKYLKGFLFRYNELSNDGQRIGVPRGLAFSSDLAELCMKPIDVAIKEIDGVYYYKRYVDDIILVADPTKGAPEEYWQKIDEIISQRQFKLHQDTGKRHLATIGGGTGDDTFEYLGYSFCYSQGKLAVRMSERRYQKYITLIDAIFEIYGQCANYRTGKCEKDGHRHMRMDALHQLFVRLRTLSSNGFLTGRKNYVASGIFYTNKYLTDEGQLVALDRHLSAIIDDKECFNPPTTLFHYGEGNGYEENIAQIKRRLHQISFVVGFRDRLTYRKNGYNHTMRDLQHIYNSR